ncbi:MAG TPA: HEAT repeat domain-containing protein [Myxococcota bacterium]|nr:HEAT repeat domain-containing protein [Myxococcota bacterium]HRY92170.1 HEAT repeat domain-containing protein [Myxococcota bacterium]HSA20638.1 HEAT repeat domain-containing protein [Myxococcota bacterium]
MDHPKNKQAPATEEPQARIAFLECWVEQLQTEVAMLRRAAEAGRAEVEAAVARAAEAEAALAGAEHERAGLAEHGARLGEQLRALEAARGQDQARQEAARVLQANELRAAILALEVHTRERTLQQARLQDARERLRALESAHDRLFQRLLEVHAQAARGEPTEIDLAAFIAELRSEVQSLQELLARAEARRGPDQAPAAPADAKAPPASAERASLLARVAGPADLPLAERLLADLEAPGPADARLRAAAKLLGLGGAAAAPFLAATAAREPELRAGLVRALGAAGEPALLPTIEGFLADEAGEVRAAALDAAAELAASLRGEEAEGFRALLERLALDPDPGVRRRVAVHAAGVRAWDPGALAARLLADPEPAVRRVACAALAGTRQIPAICALLGALLDPEPNVRAAAGRAAVQALGPRAEGLLELAEDARRAAVEGLTGYLATRGELELPGQAPPAGRGRPASPALEDVRRVLRSSLGGLSPAALGRELGQPPDALEHPLETWVRAGEVVRRGGKLFLP